MQNFSMPSRHQRGKISPRISIYAEISQDFYKLKTFLREENFLSDAEVNSGRRRMFETFLAIEEGRSQK